MGYQLAWNWEKAPEEWELEKKRNKLNRLKLILSQRELRLQLISKDLEIFIGKYLRIVGVRLAKLDKIEAEIADILAANQPENLDAQYRAEKAWERASESVEISYVSQHSLWFAAQHEFSLPFGVRLSGNYLDTQTADGSYESFAEAATNVTCSDWFNSSWKYRNNQRCSCFCKS